MAEAKKTAAKKPAAKKVETPAPTVLPDSTPKVPLTEAEAAIAYTEGVEEMGRTELAHIGKGDPSDKSLPEEFQLPEQVEV